MPHRVVVTIAAWLCAEVNQLVVVVDIWLAGRLLAYDRIKPVLQPALLGPGLKIHKRSRLTGKNAFLFSFSLLHLSCQSARTKKQETMIQVAQREKRHEKLRGDHHWIILQEDED